MSRLESLRGMVADAWNDISNAMRVEIVGGLIPTNGQAAGTARNPLCVAVSNGAYTTATHTTAAVATATTVVVAANHNRLYLLLTNDSDTTIYLKLGASAVANEGIRLNAAGGSYEMCQASGNLYTGAVNGIHAGASTKVVTVLEGV
jgi:hypothetical protein